MEMKLNDIINVINDYNDISKDYLIFIRINNIYSHIFYKHEISKVINFLPKSLLLRYFEYNIDNERKRVILDKKTKILS